MGSGTVYVPPRGPPGSPQQFHTILITKNPVFSQKIKDIEKKSVLGEISCRRLTHYQPHFLILLNVNFFYQKSNYKCQKKCLTNIPDIKQTFVKHFLNTFGIKNGPPPEPPAPLEAPAPFLMTISVQRML